MATNNLRLVAYLRDSGGTDQDLSLAQQEDAIRSWCAEHGHRLTAIYKDEAASGGSTVGRDGFHALMHHFSEADCRDQGVILWKYNRFARDFDDAQFYKADLRRRGYLVKSMNDQVPDGSDGRLFEAAIDWMNERYREDLRKDVDRGLRHMVLTLGGVSMSTPAPGLKIEEHRIGTRRNGKPHNVRKLVPDAEMVETVRHAWQMRAAGHSLQGIHAELKKKFKPLYTNPNTYSRMFINPIYIGELHYFKKKADKVVIPEFCEAIIDREVWDKVQALNQRNKAKLVSNRMKRSKESPNPEHPRRRASNYLLSGLLFCANCGALLSGRSSLNNQGTKYHYYTCPEKVKNKDACRTGNLPKEILESKFLSMAANFLSSPELLEEIFIRAKDKQGQAENVRSRIETMELEVIASTTRIEKILKAIETSGHSPSLLQRLAALEAHIEECEFAIRELRQVRPGKPISKKELAAALLAVLETSGDEDKRMLLHSIVKSARLAREKKEITGEVILMAPVKVMSMVASTGVGVKIY